MLHLGPLRSEEAACYRARAFAATADKMTAVSGDNLKSKMEELSIADKERMSAKMMQRFAWHDRECVLALQLWGTYPETEGDRANEVLVTVRGDYEAAMQVYKSIEVSQVT